jgi:hypothetical protein
MNDFSKLLILLFVFLISNSCKRNLSGYVKLYKKHIEPYVMNSNYSVNVIDYFYSPFIVNDSAIFISVAYVWDIETGDTLRLLSIEGNNENNLPGQIVFAAKDEKLFQNKSIYFRDTLYFNKRLKTSVGNVIFMYE